MNPAVALALLSEKLVFIQSGRLDFMDRSHKKTGFKNHNGMCL